MREKSFFLLFVLSFIYLYFNPFIMNSAKAASPIYVRTDGSDTICNGTVNAPSPGFGMNQPCAVATIQKGVNIVDAGGVVIVDAGVYTETVVINQPVTVRGAQAGNDARTRPNNPVLESIVDSPSNSFLIAADNVTLDGFIIQNTSGGFGIAIYPNPTVSGYKILNNIVQNNILGLYGNSSGVHQSRIQFNVFSNNNLPGGASGNGIYTDSGSQNVLVDSNLFINNENCGMIFISFGGAFASDLTITHNEVEQNGGGICLFSASNVLISENFIHDNSTRGVVVGGGNNQVIIRNNTITSNITTGIIVSDRFGYGLNQNINVISNAITKNGTAIVVTSNGLTGDMQVHFNRIVKSVTGLGIENASGVTIQAQNNWWGCNAGPNDTSGKCDQAKVNVAFDPWLILRLTANPVFFTNNQTSKLTSDLIFNSQGAETSGLGHIPDSTPVSFASTFGAVDPQDTTLTDGQAMSILTPENFNGSGKVSATVDNQTVTLEVEVNPATSPALPILRGSSCNLGNTPDTARQFFLFSLLSALLIPIYLKNFVKRGR